MSGFFKKLFNRIVGKTEEAPPPPPVVEQLEAPVPVIVEAIPEPVAPEPQAEVIPEPVRIEPKAKAAPEPKKAEPKPKAKPEPKKVEAKKTEPKKAEPKKIGVKKVEPAKPEPKKVEAKKPEPVKPEAKKPEPKKVEARKPEPVKPEPKKAEAKKLEPIKPEPVMIVPPPERPPPLTPPHKGEGDFPVKLEPVIPVQDVEPVIASPEPVQARGWLSRLTQGLSKSSKSITSSITSIFTKRKLDATTLEELEDVLIQADLGIAVSERIVKAVSAGRYDKEIEPEEVKRILAQEVAKVLKPVEVPFNFGSEKPFVVLVVGVNGAGKTTTIGKLGAIATGEGFKVMFAACDTFRAAAIEQLTIWGERVGAKTLSRPTGSDSSGLAY
ncbi:MAG: signal recognition particle receptor subunit alpha, partial [Aestuariivirga sp.]|nr:signal recognition particle receptor subunit alpha [Aestuariivirga sp.]